MEIKFGNVAQKQIIFITSHFPAFENRLVKSIREFDILCVMKITSLRQIKSAVSNTILAGPSGRAV